jgi:uncharacterized protein YijF (DUF1287 family)
MEKLSGLVLQLKVKTGFIVGDDLEPLVNDEIEKAKKDYKYVNILDDTYVVIDEKQLEDLNTRISDKQYETWLREIKASATGAPALSQIVVVLAFEEAYLAIFIPAGKMQKKRVCCL